MAEKKALVVEDAHDSAMLLARVLKLLGYQAQVAYDGRSALDNAARATFDVAFLDIGLPDMDGYELVQALRALPTVSATRIVAVTGFAPPASRDEVRRLGFDRFVTKPVNIPALRSLVEELEAEARCETTIVDAPKDSVSY